MDLRGERRTWTLIYVCLGVVEGGTAAVMVRSLFGDAVAGIAVDLVLAVVSAAPAWANLVSLAYARRAQGRPKIQFLRPLLVAMSVCVAGLALLPVGGPGLAAFLVLYGSARVLWAGVDTVRSVIWSVNYPRHLRARVTGRIMVNGAIALAVAGLLLGWLLGQQGPWYRLAILGAAAAGILGSLQFRSLRVRQEQRLLEDERERLRDGARFDLSGVRQLLAGDARFRRYMLAMSVFGAGHLMLTPLLVVCIDDVLGAPEIVQVAVTAALPVLVMPVGYPRADAKVPDLQRLPLEAIATFRT
jgi:MFS family permease